MRRLQVLRRLRAPRLAERARVAARTFAYTKTGARGRGEGFRADNKKTPLMQSCARVRRIRYCERNAIEIAIFRTHSGLLLVDVHPQGEE